MNILYVFADSQREWNCSEWRCAVPMRAINDMLSTSGSEPPLDVDAQFSSAMIDVHGFTEGTEESVEKVKEADLIVIQRLGLANVIPRMMEAQANGKVVVIDLDDAYHFMPPTVRAYKFWHEGLITVQGPDGKPQQGKMAVSPIEQLEWGIKLAHGMTTPSPTIAKDWEKFNDNTWVVPNYIASQHYLPYKKRRQIPEQITIGWGGSHSHFDSWKKTNIVEALRRICANNTRVRIYICGGNKEILGLFKSDDFQGRVVEYKWVPHNEWPRMLSKFDIGLVPLSGRYDARRSWIKTLEYTLMGIPWVGTKAPPTEELGDYGYRVTNSVGGWEKGIQGIIDDLEGARARVDAGFEVAQRADVTNHTSQLLDIYMDIYKTIKGRLP